MWNERERGWSLQLVNGGPWAIVVPLDDGRAVVQLDRGGSREQPERAVCADPAAGRAHAERLMLWQ